MADFEPELGQMCFSNGGAFSKCLSPKTLKALWAIGKEVERRKLCSGNPTMNVGDSYENAVFKMRAYCWCDGDRAGHENGCPPNFEWRDFKATWYKHAGRSNSQNRQLTDVEIAEMLSECMESMK